MIWSIIKINNKERHFCKKCYLLKETRLPFSTCVAGSVDHSAVAVVHRRDELAYNVLVEWLPTPPARQLTFLVDSLVGCHAL